jgi:pimeloyl-ACP methyl ester carboxylesterase
VSAALPTAAARRAPPDAPLVVLIHGVGFGPPSMRTLSLLLAQRGARVHVFAQRGYGARAHLSPAATVIDHVDDLLAELDARGDERAVLVGVSGGATVALVRLLLGAAAWAPSVFRRAPGLRSSWSQVAGICRNSTHRRHSPS